MSQLIFEIPGSAVPQGRPRFASRGGFSVVYDPAKSKEWKKYVRECAIAAGCTPLSGPLRLRLTFYLQAPKNLAAKLRRGDHIAHIKKPDLSNIIKSIEDALEGICYFNDSQITGIVAAKTYAVSSPCTLVTLVEI